MTDFMTQADEEELLLEEQAMMMAIEEQALMLAMEQSLRESEEAEAMNESMRLHKQEMFGVSYRKPGLKANRHVRTSARPLMMDDDTSGRTAMMDESGRTMDSSRRSARNSVSSFASASTHNPGYAAAAYGGGSSLVVEEEEEDIQSLATVERSNSPHRRSKSPHRRSNSPRPGFTVPPDNLQIPTEPTGGAVWSTSMINLKTDAVTEESCCVTADCVVSPTYSPETSLLSNGSSHASGASSDGSHMSIGGSSYHSSMDSSHRSSAMDSSRRSNLTRPSSHQRRQRYERGARTAVSRPIVIPPVEPAAHATANSSRNRTSLTTAAVRRVSNTDNNIMTQDSSLVAESSNESQPQPQQQPRRKPKSLVSRVSQRILGASSMHSKRSSHGSETKKKSSRWTPAPKMKQDQTHPSGVNLVDAAGDYQDLNNTDHQHIHEHKNDHMIREDHRAEF